MEKSQSALSKGFQNYRPPNSGRSEKHSIKQRSGTKRIQQFSLILNFVFFQTLRIARKMEKVAIPEWLKI
jgi:hypothetical protein